MIAVVLEQCLGFKESMQENIESGCFFDLNCELRAFV